MIRLIFSLVAFVLVLGAIVVAYAMATGLDARTRPGEIETEIARAVRGLAIPRAIRDRPNPVAFSPEVLADGLAHYADHCASCHGTNGDGNTEMGRGLFPKPPDMRLATTQQLTDGELFYIIEHGVRFTGMPGWSTGTENASWRLVHFIRRLPQLTTEDLERVETLTPRSPDEIRQQIEEEQFLKGGDAPSAPSSSSGHAHTGAHQ
jgi:mono/diheme cytochrome c family protein